MKRFVLALMLGSVWVNPVFAKDWVIDYSHSSLGFIGNQSGAAFTGGFKRFQTIVDLDPAKPEAGKISATIDVTSITANDSERDSYLPQADWFSFSTFPQAQFISSGIRKTGDQSYVADGTLTIKGIAKPLSLPFTLKPEGDHWRAQGRVTLIRTDFHVGDHDWANEDYVKRAVDVVLDLTAKPAP